MAYIDSRSDLLDKHNKSIARREGEYGPEPCDRHFPAHYVQDPLLTPWIPNDVLDLVGLEGDMFHS
jgi:hypothetical protein